jgi:hypothetical protein
MQDLVLNVPFPRLSGVSSRADCLPARYRRFGCHLSSFIDALLHSMHHYELARQLLGAPLLDSMYLYLINIILEESSDKILLQGAREKLSAKGKVKTDPSEIRIFEGGNASGACTLYETIRNLVDDKKIRISLTVDCENAGEKALKGLLNPTQNNYKLKANKDYYQLDKNRVGLT